MGRIDSENVLGVGTNKGEMEVLDEPALVRAGTLNSKYNLVLQDTEREDKKGGRF